MIRGLFTLLAFVSTILFPWPFTVPLVIGLALFEPLAARAIGLFADTLYYSAQAGAFPQFTLYGAVVTALAFFVRSRLKTSIIGE